MGGQKDFCAFEGSNSGILTNIVVVANEDAEFAVMWRVEDSILVARGYVCADETVKLSVVGEFAVGHCDDVSVVKSSVVGNFDEACAYGDLVLLCEV